MDTLQAMFFLHLIAQSLAESSSWMSSLSGFVQLPHCSSAGVNKSSRRPMANFSGVPALRSTSKTCSLDMPQFGMNTLWESLFGSPNHNPPIYGGKYTSKRYG